MKTTYVFILTLLILLSSCRFNPHEKGKETNTATNSSNSAQIDPDTTDTISPEKYVANASNTKTAVIVARTLREIYKTDIEKDLIDSINRKFVLFEYDLNGDKQNEIFVGLSGMYFCGSGGCTFYILSSEGKIITEFSVSEYPIIIESSSTKGWRNLVIESNGKLHLLKWNGKKYPSNPSVQPVLDRNPNSGITKALNYLNEPYPWFSF